MIDTKQTLKPQTKVDKMAGTKIDAARAETLKIISRKNARRLGDRKSMNYSD
jgi:hypothetical protein